MKKTIYIIGTDHGYQNLNSDFTKEQHSSFAKMVSDFVNSKNIEVISEENNQEALEEKEINISSLQQIASETNKFHLFAEADRKYRNENGMKQENDIRMSGLMKGLDEEEIRQKILDSYRKREKYWLGIIEKFNVWPVLHVCGANHSIEFEKLVKGKDINATLLHKDWSN